MTDSNKLENTMLIAGEYTHKICNHLNLKTFDIKYKVDLENSNLDLLTNAIHRVVILDTGLSSLMKWEVFIDYVLKNPSIEFVIVSRYKLITHGRLNELENLTIKEIDNETLDPLKILFNI